jgi:hypothetical protein
MKNLILTLAACITLAPAALLAQNPQDISQRRTDQQDRIAQGVRSGQLTARETGHIEHQEAGINREERGMRAQDNGHLTHQDRRTINHQQNQESRDKHNAAHRG